MSKIYYVVSNELYHHGIKGQKWGVRRFQNEDGSLTSKGQKRYNKNKKLISSKLTLHDSTAKRERRQAEAYTKSAEDLRKNGKASLDAQFGNSISEAKKEKSLRIAIGEREYNAAYLEASAKGREWYTNELRKLDLSSMSTKDVKRNMKELEQKGREYGAKYLDDAIAGNQNISEAVAYRKSNPYG